MKELKGASLWRDRFQRVGAMWIYDGEPSADKPHALLASGKHSGGYVDCAKIMAYPVLVQQAAAKALQRLTIFNDHPDFDFDAVYGSAMGAITWAHELARGASYLGSPVLTGYTEKDGKGGMSLGRFQVKPGDRVLMCEDVITSGGTTVKSISTLLAAGAVVVPTVVVLINRHSSDGVFSGPDGTYNIISVLDVDFPTYQPDECPYCKAGSTLIEKPKYQWAQLTGQEA